MRCKRHNGALSFKGKCALPLGKLVHEEDVVRPTGDDDVDRHVQLVPPRRRDGELPDGVPVAIARHGRPFAFALEAANSVSLASQHPCGPSERVVKLRARKGIKTMARSGGMCSCLYV